jgi:TatD DNase family protein
MICDAHAHPKDLLEKDPGAETIRRKLNIAVAASAWNPEEFDIHRRLAETARAEGGPPLYLCFAVHPQAAGESAVRNPDGSPYSARAALEALEDYAAGGLLAAVGETGFDLYNETLCAAEAGQEALFAAHLETALRHGLPVVLHVRRAMNKLFPYTKELKKLPAVVFHSWPGSPAEGFAFLRRGVNAFFSFGAAITINHKNAIRSCAAFPQERLLFETDAPWQPPRGKSFSSWDDIFTVINAAAALRNVSPGELEQAAAGNFFKVFKPSV